MTETKRICLNCDYWYVDSRTVLTTETRGQCLALGSPHDDSEPGMSCDCWQEVDEQPAK